MLGAFAETPLTSGWGGGGGGGEFLAVAHLFSFLKPSHVLEGAGHAVMRLDARLSFQLGSLHAYARHGKHLSISTHIWSDSLHQVSVI